MTDHNLIQEISELKNHISYSKNIGFFFGAGTSCSLGIPGISDLTKNVEDALKDNSAKIFKFVKDDLKALVSGRDVNIEDILNQLRNIRELTKESETKNYQGVSGKDAALTDIDICKTIYEIITHAELKAELSSTKRFFAWYNNLNRDFTKEIFTTNYDLIIEKALESSEIPYFDGFVGSYEPFFWQQSIDHHVQSGDLTKNWIRLWKIHGSLSWFWSSKDSDKSTHIIRIGHFGESKSPNKELVIYPSKDKYDSSRKQPFIAYFDRLRDYLLSGELLFIISGYSFSDQHINEIIMNCLRQNNRLFINVFLYSDSDVKKLSEISSVYMNLHIFGPTKAIINGELGEWSFTEEDGKPSKITELFWDEGKKQFTLGDFNALVNFLVTSSGNSEKIQKEAS